MARVHRRNGRILNDMDLVIFYSSWKGKSGADFQIAQLWDSQINPRDEHGGRKELRTITVLPEV